MGLDIYLKCDGEQIAHINWLRCPFGLIDWVKDITKPANTKYTLWEVSNKWSYADSDKIEKDEFLKTVMAYSDQVDKLEEAYFFFNLMNYRTFVEPNLDKMILLKDIFGRYTTIAGEKYADDGRLMVPVSQFRHVMGYDMSLEDYNSSRLQSCSKSPMSRFIAPTKNQHVN